MASVRPTSRVDRSGGIDDHADGRPASQGARTSTMIRSPRLATASLMILSVCGLIASSDGPRTLGQESKGFHPLFNGKDLTGWVTPADKSLFTVEDGEIVGR